MRSISIAKVSIFSLIAIIGCIFFIKLNSNSKEIQSYLGTSIDNSELDNYLSQKMSESPIPGLAVGIINNGQLTHHFYKGYENLDSKKPVNKNTLFEAASLSKPVFGSMVMQQVDKGVLTLDKPLFDYFPVEYTEDSRFMKITSRMALSHQTGWPNWRWDYSHQKLEFKHSPGKHYLYSGEGYQYLAETLRHLHGGSWQDLESQFQNDIALPLGMTNSTFIEPTPVSSLKASPYDLQGKLIDFERLNDYQRNKGVFVAAASLVTNIEDFSKWMIAVMNNQLLSKESQKELLSPQIGSGHRLLTEVFYTLGFFELKVPAVSPLYGHGGKNHGFTGYFVLSPDEKWGFVLLSNSEYGEQLGIEVLGYLITGPNLVPFIIIAVFVLILLVCLLITLVKLFSRLLKKDHVNKG